MEQTVKGRLILFIRHLNIGQSKFEKQCGLANGYINNIRKSITTEKLQQIALTYPELNKSWLMTGEGEMLKDKNPKSSADDSLREKYITTLELLLAERDKEIKELKHQLIKLKLRRAGNQRTTESEEAI